MTAVIVGAAFCPHPPLLVPEVAQGAAAELDDLRAACRTAIRSVCADVRVVIVGSGSRNWLYPFGARGSLARFGMPVEAVLGTTDPDAPDDLPPALTIGGWLIHDALGDTRATGWETADGGPPPMPNEPFALLVMGDGSARRSTSAPGYLDERAAGFDAAVADALRGGRPAELRVDAVLGQELLAAGVPAWHAAAALLEPLDYETELLYDAAPYGVGYFVAAWTPK